MKHLGAFVGAVAVALLVGCGPADEPPAVEQLDAQASELASEQPAVPVPDSDMLQALAAACMPTNTNSCVNAGYQSCGSWSAYYDCGELTECDGSAVNCRQRICDPDGYCYWVTTGTQFQGRNRYRVCANAAQQLCTEYEKTSRTVCGCGGEPL